MKCFKAYDAARGVRARDARRLKIGAIKRSSEITETRECSCCRKFKNTKNDFYWKPVADRSIPDRMCKACKYEWSSKHRKINSDRYAAYAKEARLRNPDKFRAEKNAYRKTQKGIEATRRYTLENKERARLRRIAYYRTEKGRISAMAKRQKHRARKEKSFTELSHLVTDKWVSKMFSDYENKCVYCGEVGNLTMDHVIPISRNGKHEPSNIVPACHLCNSVKRDKLVSEWRPWVVIPAYGLDLSTG